jgi:battenin
VSQSFGEAVFLGFLKGYPSGLIGDVSTGTGFAGIFATGTLLTSKAIGLDDKWLFLIEMPTILVYYFSFSYLNKQKKIYPLESEEKETLVQRKSSVVEEADEAEVKNNQRLNVTTIKSLMPRTFHLILNLFTVYFLEYSIITSFADAMGQQMKLLYPDKLDSLVVKEYFVILNASYQVGVFFSRSSLRFVRIPANKVWLLTMLQLCNFTLIFLNAYYMTVTTLWVMCPLIVWVGLMGGGSYVNVLNGILELETLDKTEKEMALSLSLLFNDTGILLATVFSLIMSSTVFKFS